eukprot:611239-Rhodomonas_salina.1
MPLSSAGARPVKRLLNLAVAARELAAARLCSEQAKKQKLNRMSSTTLLSSMITHAPIVIGHTDTASKSEPVVERTALAVLSANIQLLPLPVQGEEETENVSGADKKSGAELGGLVRQDAAFGLPESNLALPCKIRGGVGRVGAAGCCFWLTGVQFGPSL